MYRKKEKDKPDATGRNIAGGSSSSGCCSTSTSHNNNSNSNNNNSSSSSSSSSGNTKNVRSTNIVVEWLTYLKLDVYADSFLDNGYDDLEVCKQIGEADLDEIGVMNRSDRIKLLKSATTLRHEGAAPVYFLLEKIAPPPPPIVSTAVSSSAPSSSTESRSGCDFLPSTSSSTTCSATAVAATVTADTVSGDSSNVDEVDDSRKRQRRHHVANSSSIRSVRPAVVADDTDDITRQQLLDEYEEGKAELRKRISRVPLEDASLPEEHVSNDENQLQQNNRILTATNTSTSAITTNSNINHNNNNNGSGIIITDVTTSVVPSGATIVTTALIHRIPSSGALVAPVSSVVSSVKDKIGLIEGSTNSFDSADRITSRASPVMKIGSKSCRDKTYAIHPASTSIRQSRNRESHIDPRFLCAQPYSHESIELSQRNQRRAHSADNQTSSSKQVRQHQTNQSYPTNSGQLEEMPSLIETSKKKLSTFTKFLKALRRERKAKNVSPTVTYSANPYGPHLQVQYKQLASSSCNNMTNKANNEPTTSGITVPCSSKSFTVDDTYAYQDELITRHWYDEPPYESDPEDMLMQQRKLREYEMVRSSSGETGSVISLRSAGDITLPRKFHHIQLSPINSNYHHGAQSTALISDMGRIRSQMSTLSINIDDEGDRSKYQMFDRNFPPLTDAHKRKHAYPPDRSVHEANNSNSCRKLYVPSSSSYYQTSDDSSNVNERRTIVVAQAVAIRNCTSVCSDELQFSKGELIKVLNLDSSGVWEGVVNGQVGYFNSSDVQLITNRSYDPTLDNISFKYPCRKIRRHRPRTLDLLLEAIHMQEYKPLFVINGFDDLETFCRIDNDDLDYLKIYHPGDRAKILAAVQVMHEYESPPGDDSTDDDDCEYCSQRTAPQFGRSFYNRTMASCCTQTDSSPTASTSFAEKTTKFKDHHYYCNIDSFSPSPRSTNLFSSSSSNEITTNVRSYHHPPDPTTKVVSATNTTTAISSTANTNNAKDKSAVTQNVRRT